MKRSKLKVKAYRSHNMYDKKEKYPTLKQTYDHFYKYGHSETTSSRDFSQINNSQYTFLKKFIVRKIFEM